MLVQHDREIGRGCTLYIFNKVLTQNMCLRQKLGFVYAQGFTVTTRWERKLPIVCFRLLLLIEEDERVREHIRKHCSLDRAACI